MRSEMDRSERFSGRARASSGEFAPLFEQLRRPVDRGAVVDGMHALSRWLGSPHRRVAGMDR